MTVDIESFTPEMIESYERLNLFFHVHHCNQEMLTNTLDIVEKLQTNPGTTLSPEMLVDWLSAAGFVFQTIDALMHLLQREHVGPALEMAKSLSDEDKMYIRDNFKSPGLDKMLEILTETEETRTQRMLLEHLNIHE